MFCAFMASDWLLALLKTRYGPHPMVNQEFIDDLKELPKQKWGRKVFN